MHRSNAKLPARSAGLILACAGLLISSAPALAHGREAHRPLARDGGAGGGAVYTETNGATGNSLLVFNRTRTGALTPGGSFATGGLGTGTGLGSGHSVVAADSGRVVLAVNGASNTVSAFVRGPRGLRLAGAPADSAGTTPTSVTAHGRLVYVMNAGSGTISGFWLSGRWGLIPIPGSTQSLAASGTGIDSQIQFDRSGRVLIVDERGTANLLQTFVIGPGGAAESAGTIPANAGGPFGFDVDRAGHVLFSNAAFGTSSGASSYDVAGDGTLTPNGPPVTTGQAAACWLAAVGPFAYTDNAGSGSIGRFSVARDGSLTLTGTTVISASAHPLDMAGAGGRFLYVLADGLHEVIGYRVGAGGELTAVSTVAVPAGVDGLGAQ